MERTAELERSPTTNREAYTHVGGVLKASNVPLPEHRLLLFERSMSAKAAFVPADQFKIGRYTWQGWDASGDQVWIYADVESQGFAHRYNGRVHQYTGEAWPCLMKLNPTSGEGTTRILPWQSAPRTQDYRVPTNQLAVTRDFVFIHHMGVLHRFPLAGGDAAEVPLPGGEPFRLRNVGGRLLASSETTLLHIDGDSLMIDVLVSTRRRPAKLPADNAVALEGSPWLGDGGRIRIAARTGKGLEVHEITPGDSRGELVATIPLDPAAGAGRIFEAGPERALLHYQSSQHAREPHWFVLDYNSGRRIPELAYTADLLPASALMVPVADSAPRWLVTGGFGHGVHLQSSSPLGNLVFQGAPGPAASSLQNQFRPRNPTNMLAVFPAGTAGGIYFDVQFEQLPDSMRRHLGDSVFMFPAPAILAAMPAGVAAMTIDRPSIFYIPYALLKPAVTAGAKSLPKIAPALLPEKKPEAPRQPQGSNQLAWIQSRTVDEKRALHRDPGAMESHFDQIDINGDLAINPWEAAFFQLEDPRSISAEEEQAMETWGRVLTRRMFAVADVDGDRRLSRLEIQKWNWNAPLTIPTVYAAADIDGNQALTVEELEHWQVVSVIAEIEFMNERRASKRSGFFVPPYLNAYDLNQDGRIDQQEHEALNKLRMPPP